MEEHHADGVFEGGGVKGLALAGALVEFADSERHPESYVDRWVKLAGTSAGAIVAAYLACGHSAADTAALIDGTDFSKFEDWGPGGALLGGTLNLIRNHGLAHGKVFHDWFRDEIDNQKFGDVTAAGRELKLIATDITRREMLVLPDALAKYKLSASSEAIDPESFPVADAVRMSMSIPYFFQPVELIHAETGLSSTIVDGGVLSNFTVWILDVE
jgi:NTE family protein